MYQYPYGNAQQLNLDWILSKLQELESGSGGGADLEEVANALVSASFDATIPYRKYDYAFYDGKLYRALNDTIGAFNPADWLEVTLGADIPVLTRLLNAVDASLTTLQGQVADLDSDDVDNASNVTGTTVTDALDNLNGAINDGFLPITGTTQNIYIRASNGLLNTHNTYRSLVFVAKPNKTYRIYSTGDRLLYGFYNSLTADTAPINGIYVNDPTTPESNHFITNSGNGTYLVVQYATTDYANSTAYVFEETDIITDINGAINHAIFAVAGTLKSNISSSGNIFTQTATDARITSSTNVAGVTIDDENYVTSPSIIVTPGTGTVTITGTTASFTGTINMIVELYN